MDNLLTGMKEICSFLKLSPPTVLKWIREYPDFPIRKAAGVWVSDRELLQEWFLKYLKGER